MNTVKSPGVPVELCEPTQLAAWQDE